VDTGNFKVPALSCDQPDSVCYDIVYVRYPIKDSDTDPYVTIPVGEKPYLIAPGADLMLLKKGGDEVVLVDCDTCSVMDPFISLDGKTVYYSMIEGPAKPTSASWIYKIHLDDPSYTPIRLTFDDGYDSVQYAGNKNTSGTLKSADHDQSRYRQIRDMAPVPLADGRLLFTSNRAALTTFHPFADGVVKGSMQMLYVMDDHDGSANTKELSNLHLLETGNLHMVQHPIQLMDGRLLFSSWQDAGTKFGKHFQYASTPLFTVHPDGSNLQQFTEPHDHHKTVDHFVTQLPGGEIVWENYYPGAWGYGLLMRAPLDPEGPDFLRGSIDQRYPYGNQYKISFREFDRKGTVAITPHTNNSDTAANNLSGKYSMPSVTSNGNLLVAYSTGGTSKFQDADYPLASGIYMIRNAAGGEADYITDPQAQLIKVKDDPNYNEIWPRAVLSYGDIYGISKPNIINNLAISGPDDNHLLPGEAAALLGTSSMYNREPLNEGDPDPFQPPSGGNRENHDGNWTIQGAEAGVFTDDDIYAVRIIATPPKPFTATIDKQTGTFAPCTPDGTDDWSKVCRHLEDPRLEHVVARYGSYHGERWEILGEFPVKKPDVTDGHGEPDTSWQAKIPADMPTFIQTIDKNGMTLVSELTWRALKSGEKRTDCGGCHAHSTEPLDFNTTEAGKNKPIVGVAGVNSSDARVKDGIWDLTLNSIPLLNATGVTFEPGYSYGVEFNRDIVPILNNRCVSCHKAGGTGSKFILDGSGGRDAWSVISEDGSYAAPQRSRYIRTPQARQSLFVWAAWDERLDGRSNSTRSNDIDYSAAADTAHDALTITDKERRTIARWVDLGGPIDFPESNGFGYTDDYQLPVVNIFTPHQGSNSGAQLKVGFNDALSGLDWGTLSVKYRKLGSAEQTLAINVGSEVNAKNILTKNLPIGAGEYIITVSINDIAGNTGVATRRFTIN
jgi:hypothetical protein